MIEETLTEVAESPLISTKHESLPQEWDVHDGIQDILQALLGEREDQRKIAEMGVQIVSMLLTKNRQYGNAALDPVRVFSGDLPPIAMISVRIDDKLSRIKRGAGADDTEDPLYDLIGYGILYLIARHDEEHGDG